jgi:hypothetical protein
MAVIHRADLKPTKLELLADRLGVDGDLTRVASYRFDDPAGDAGVETLLVRSGDGPVLQVPLTYRGAPLDGADDHLIGTTEHSVLGRRWVYDACGDPVYAAELARAIIADAGQAEQTMAVDGRVVVLPPTMAIASTGDPGAEVPVVGRVRRVVPGDPTIIETDGVRLTVVRELGAQAPAESVVLTGTWKGQPEPVVLAHASVG